MENEELIEIKKKLEDHEKRILQLENILQSKPETTKKGITIKEFILDKKPKDAIQKALAIGYYLENFQGVSSFNLKDLDNGFREAREPVPENIADKVQKNVAKDRMMKTKQEKDNINAYVLTNKGEQFVERGFKEE